MKGKDLNTMLEELKEKMDKIIDEKGLREDFEKFKKEKAGKSLEELLDELKESILKKNGKPEYELMIKSNEDGETHKTKIVGYGSDVLFGLSELVADMQKQCDIPKEIIMKAVELGLNDEEE